MTHTSTAGVEAILAEIRDQLRALAGRVERLEKEHAPAVAAPENSAAPVHAAVVPDDPAPAPEGIPEEHLLAISAALAAYFGVRVRVRQVRLISSPAWAQQGRVSIQASHRLLH